MYNSHSDIWVAGAFAAVIVDFFVYPFDTLKTRIQSPDYEKVFKDPRTGAVRRNVLFRGVYQGVWSVVFSTVPSSGAFFTTYEAVKSALHNSRKNNNGDDTYANPGSPNGIKLPFTHSLPSPIIHAIASSSGEMVACLILTPAEVLKQNAQMVDGQSPNNKGSSTGNKTAMGQVLARFRRHPWRLWSGYTALVGRNLPFTGLQFPIFEYVRSNVIDWRRRRKADRAAAASGSGSGSTGTDTSEQREQLIERAGLTGLSASVSGTIASIVTTPIDVIKTRVMLSASGNNSPSSDKEAKSKSSKGKGAASSEKTATKQPKMRTLAVGREIYRNEGVRGLFKGGALRAGWTAVSLSMYLSLYEGGRFYLENRRKDREGLHGGQRVASEEGETVM
ncbi:Mitochondrial substrate/solute carrier [Penicillium riverlandense]|uniref:Mitochondrial substrate/solute carrier n=1 Tax=Penicillium riverlandense TaxID=1903569 RepID=UPI0025484660|nr:Mitochondrial substrate/solute carrier [Penicillium riverlandense]KAJ5832432.1 Mitochondrial substrate/solute carrier [Penicillium riverlandense]